MSIMAEVLQTTGKLGPTITPDDIISSKVRVLEIIRGPGGQLTMGELMERVTRDLTQKDVSCTLNSMARNHASRSIAAREVGAAAALRNAGESITIVGFTEPGHPVG